MINRKQFLQSAIGFAAVLVGWGAKCGSDPVAPDAAMFNREPC